MFLGLAGERTLGYIYKTMRCNAKTRAGGLCRQWARKGGVRCRMHAGRRPGFREHPNSKAARLEGRRKWVERMRLAKAQGLIEKFPCGRKRGMRFGSNDRIRSPDPRSARLERMAERTIDELLAALDEGRLAFEP